MKKNFLSFIFTICLIIPCMFIITACNEDPPPPPDNTPTLTNVEVIIDDMLTHYYDSDTKTFSISYDNHVSFDSFYFTVLGTYSDNTTNYIYDNVNISIPSELQSYPIAVSATPYEIVVTYDTYTFTYYVNILAHEVAIPIATDKTYEYNDGNSLDFEWDSIDYNYIDISNGTQSTPGTHTVTATLRDGCVWADGTSEPKTFNWIIEKAKIDTPTYVDNYMIRYSNLLGDFAPSIYDFEIDNNMLALDVESQSNVGNYTAKLIISDNYSDYYEWAEDDVDITLHWSIAKGLLTKPTYPDGTTFEYNPYLPNYKAEIGINNFDSDLMTVTGNSATEAGDYTATVSIIDTSKYMWDDATDTDISFDWHISRFTVYSTPSLAETFVYNGSSHTPLYEDVENYSDELYYFSNDSTLSAIDAGKYHVILTLKDTKNCQWSDESSNDKVFDWEITPKGIYYYFETESYDYNFGETITAYSDISTDLYVVSGNTATTVGNYTASIYLKDKKNYKWKNYEQYTAPSSVDIPFSASWSVNPYYIDLELSEDEFTYNGEEQSVSFNWTREGVYTISGETSGIDVKPNYQVTTKLLDTTNYRWHNETVGGYYTTNDLTFTWKIKTKHISNAEHNTYTTHRVETTYNGEEQEFTIPSWYDADNMYILDVEANEETTKIARTNAGNYRFTIISKLNANEEYNYWFQNYGHNGEYSIYYYLYLDINKMALTKPTDNDTNFIYDGSLKTYTPNGYEDIKDYVTLTDNEETNANTYTSTISINDTSNYMWEDESNTNLTYEWIINKMQIVLPTEGTKEFVYEEQTTRTYVPTYNTTYITLGGTLSAIGAGDYTATFTLKDSDNTEWADETTEVKSHTWTILKRAALLAYSEDAWVGLISDNIYANLVINTVPTLSTDFTLEYPRVEFIHSYTRNGQSVVNIQGDGVFTITVTATISTWYSDNYRLPTSIEEIQKHINPDYVESTAEFIANGCQATYTRNIYEHFSYAAGTEYFDIEAGHIYAYDGAEHAPTYDSTANLDQIDLQYHIRREDVSFEETYYIYNGEKLDGKPTEVGHYYMQVVIKNDKLEVNGYTILEQLSTVYIHFFICDHSDRNVCGICTNCGLYDDESIELTTNDSGYYTVSLSGTYSADQTYYIKVTGSERMSYIIESSKLSSYTIYYHFYDEANNQIYEITCSQDQFTGPHGLSEFYVVFTPNVDITDNVVFTISQPV